MGRIVIVGDVHGCATELEELLRQIGFEAGDRLFFVGDLVVRGPEPERVLALFRRHGARGVRGNHEHRLLRWRALHARHPDRKAAALAELPEADARVLTSRWLARTAERLSDDDWQLLSSLPSWLDVGADLRIVHAGVMPGVDIADQPERTLLYVRTIDPQGRPSEQRDGGEPWGARYRGPPHIVFGHNAAEAPQLHPWATCLDTGCVYGGALTAMVLEEGQPVPPPDERRRVLRSVAAKQVYFQP